MKFKNANQRKAVMAKLKNWKQSKINKDIFVSEYGAVVHINKNSGGKDIVTIVPSPIPSNTGKIFYPKMRYLLAKDKEDAYKKAIRFMKDRPNM